MNKKIIINKNTIQEIVKNTLSIVLLREIYAKSLYNHLNESTYAENIDNEYYYDVDFDEVASLQDKLMAMAYGLTKDMDSAKDLAQNTIMRAFEKSSLFQDGTNLLGWLRTIMLNLFRREMNNPRRKKMKYIDDYSTYDNNAIASNDDNFSTNNSSKKPKNFNEIVNNMKMAINDLSSKKGDIYNKIFDLKLNGKQVKEIADELNLNFDTTKYYLKVMRAYLRKYGFDKELKKILEI